jgi:hypothetical protein
VRFGCGLSTAKAGTRRSARPSIWFDALVNFEPAVGERQQGLRVQLGDGATTTVHASRFKRARVAPRVIALRPPRPLFGFCREEGIEDAIVGGFFIRSEGTPLGALRVGGQRMHSQAFDPPWTIARSCVGIVDGELEIGPHPGPGKEPPGDLLQAGPMLVDKSANLVKGVADPEGFASGASQFDSDITVGRYPRAALGLTNRELIAVVCDGRGSDDAGLTLTELADVMIGLGAKRAINLDGGGSASLIAGGVLVNVPREEHGLEIPSGRPVSTAIAFIPRV